ncbi:MAG: NAD(P)-binding domain-containing protein [Acidobacteria bacterium]|nr:NAD(P)-binding domain-containing protein [Acidobacteriota bacterium]
MKIGIIGAGNIGAAAAKLFTEAGHEIAIANSRGPETLTDVVAGLGPRARAATVAEAAAFGEIVFVSIPFGKYRELPENDFAGKIVIDSNNYYPSRDGRFAEIDAGTATSSELLANYLKGAKIVKGFNTIWVEHLKTQGHKDLAPDARRAIFIAGDDADAKSRVAKLIDEIGFAAVDTGSLRDGGKSQQPDTPIYNKTLTAKQAAAMLNS